MASYFMDDVIRLGLVGVAAGSFGGVAWRLAGRTRWGATPFVLAVLGAARVTDRSDWPRWDAMAATGLLVTLLAAGGASRLLADLGAKWRWVAAGSLISAFGVYAGVPETGPVLLAGGSLAGLTAIAALTGAGWAPGAGVGVAAVLGWAALSGAAGRPWAALGGALCLGVAPWFALRPRLRTYSRTHSPGPWLVGAHTVLVILAARWIGVSPHAGWYRVAVAAAAGLVVAEWARKQA